MRRTAQASQPFRQWLFTATEVLLEVEELAQGDVVVTEAAGVEEGEPFVAEGEEAEEDPEAAEGNRYLTVQD